jgi:hypothetical protein
VTDGVFMPDAAEAAGDAPPAFLRVARSMALREALPD